MPALNIMCAVQPDSRERETLNDPYGPIYRLHWKEIPNWTLREERLCGQMPRGHKRPGTNLQHQSIGLPTAYFHDSIDKKPNPELKVYFNKTNEGAAMLESSHTITQLGIHVGYARHYEHS